MKLLLFTDLPPCENYPGGLVLDELTRFLPRGQVAVFAAVNHHLQVQLSSNMDWMPAYLVDKPEEQGRRRTHPFSFFPDQIGAVEEFYRRRIVGPRILRKAVNFGREHQVDAVLAVLQGQTVIHLAERLAKAIGVPLYTLVWDPLVWWIKDGAVDPHTARVTQRAFDGAIRASQAVATASWAMARAYGDHYGVRAVPIIRSHETSYARTPEPRLHDDSMLTIGFAGQVYAVAEVAQLIRMLNAIGWTIRGRAVRLRTFGHQFPDHDIPPGKLDHMGWRADDALIDGLAGCDVLYCPYPFDQGIAEVSRLSFPSKLVAYLAAGRPVVLHGPKDSSPSIYVREKDVGLCATGKHASSIFNPFERLVADEALYARLARGAQAAFRADFTLERMKEHLEEFLGAQTALPATVGPAIASMTDERRFKGGPLRPIPKPNPFWLLKNGLMSGGDDTLHALQALACPVRQRLDLAEGWESRKHPQPVARGSDHVELSTGLQPWDYVAALRLTPRRASARYLSARVTILAEEAFALLVDENWNQLGDRIRIPADRWWFLVWFHLTATPTAKYLVFQSNAAPRRAALKVHRATLFSPISALLRRLMNR